MRNKNAGRVQIAADVIAVVKLQVTDWRAKLEGHDSKMIISGAYMKNVPTVL